MLANRKTNIGLSLIEVIIVIAIIGILAAIVLPEMNGQSQLAKEAAAKETLRVMRENIILFAVEHGSKPPGYTNGDLSKTPGIVPFWIQLSHATNASNQIATPGTPGFPFGPYIKVLPENPFNTKNTIQVLSDSEEFPTKATGAYGWIYKPKSMQFNLDTPGCDSTGLEYFKY